MSRLYAQPVHVRMDAEGVPETIRWRGRTYQVDELLGRWIEAGAWWPAARAAVFTAGTPDQNTRPQATEAVVWRVEARRGDTTAVLDLWQRADGWRVHAIAD